MGLGNNGYIGRSPGDSSVIVRRQVYQPTGVQTSFTFESGYDNNFFDVFINGAKQIKSIDFTAVDNTTFSLTSPAQNGDVIEAVAYKAFNATNSGVGIQSAGVRIGEPSTLNFIGAGNTFKVTGTTVDISIQGGGGGGSGAFTTSITGIQTTSQIVGIGTTSTDDSDLQGIGNSARGMYVSNGMVLMDNAVSGNHYIGTNFNGLMVGPVNISGTITIDGNYVVV